MTRDELLKPLEGSLRDLIRWLSERKVSFAVIGGVAAGLQGKGRATGDVDAVILTDESKLDAFIKDAASFGFLPRIPDAGQFARDNRIILLHHVDDKIGIDLSLGCLPFEIDLISRAARIKAFDLEIPVARPEELIVMKLLPFRGRDVTDIEMLLDANKDVDLDRVRTAVKAFAEVLENSEIPERLEQLLARRPSAKTAKKKMEGDSE